MVVCMMIVELSARMLYQKIHRHVSLAMTSYDGSWISVTVLIFWNRTREDLKRLRKVKSQTRKENHKGAMRVMPIVAKGEESSTTKWYGTWVHAQMVNFVLEIRPRGIMI